MQLSDAQKQAVEYLGGAQIILAGAGSGKTRVIVAKAQYLIEEKGYTPDSLLVLTYSRKTQAELEERMEALGPKAPEVSTFHSFGLEVINEFSHLLGSSGEVSKANEYALHRYRLRAISELTESILLRTVRPEAVYSDLDAFIRRAKDELVMPSETISRAQAELHALPDDPADDDDEMLIKRDRWTKIYEASRIFQSYERIKSEGAGETEIDYEDMIVLCHMLLNTERIVGATLRQRIRYILVDEFQDTNFAQVEILHLLCNNKIGITVVGDDDQAIYRFRGASFGSFKLFQRLFEKVETHRLEENYRSTENIVNAAQSVIELEPEARFDPYKRMFSRGYKGDKVRVRLCPDFQTEAESVADEIAALLQNELYRKPKSMAVLFRYRKHKDLLQKALLRRSLDFYYDKKTEEPSRPPTRLLTALYEYSVDHGRRDHLAFILNHFVSSVSPRDEREILYRLSRTETDSLETLEAIAGGFPETVSSDILRLTGLLRFLGEAKNGKEPLGFLELIISKAGILSSLIIDGKIADDGAMAEIGGLLRAAESFAEAGGPRTHGDFLEYLNWKGNQSESDTENDKADSPVVLQTVHGSKGLEYPIVFIIGLSSRRFPPLRRSATVEFPPELYKDEVPEKDVRIQEERRLFYVAMTRAKEKIYLYGVENKGTKRSQFLKELTGAPFFDDVGAVEFIEQADVEVAEIGPAEARDKSKSVIISGIAPVETALDEALYRLWRMESSTAGKEDDFEGLKKEFKTQIDAALSSVKDRIDGERYVAAERRDIYKVDRISYTDLEAFDDCPLKFYYKKVLRLPTPTTPPQLLGQTIHDTLERAARSVMGGAKPALDDLVADFESSWRKVHLADPDQKERMRQRGAELLDAFVRLNSQLDGTPLALEKTFELELPSARLTGRIDRVDKTNSGLTVIDYKTGKKNDSKLKDDLQLPIYSLACRELFGEYPSDTMFMFLGDGQTHSVPADAQSLDDVTEEIEAKIDAINSSDFAATPGNPCYFCEYARICPASV